MLGDAVRQAFMLAKAWPAMIIILLLFYSTYLHYFALGLPGTPFSRNTFLLGWPNLALQVQQKANTIEEMTGYPPVIVGMDKYRVTSGLAFYQYKIANQDDRRGKKCIIEETAGNHLFGFNSLMYQYWAPPSKFHGRNMFVLSPNARDLAPGRFIPYASHVRRLQKLYYEKFGQLIGPIYFRLLTRYQPRGNGIAEK